MSTPWIDGYNDAVFDLEYACYRDEGAGEERGVLEPAALLDADVHVVGEIGDKDPCIGFASADESVGSVWRVFVFVLGTLVRVTSDYLLTFRRWVEAKLLLKQVLRTRLAFSNSFSFRLCCFSSGSVTDLDMREGMSVLVFWSLVASPDS